MYHMDSVPNYRRTRPNLPQHGIRDGVYILYRYVWAQLYVIRYTQFVERASWNGRINWPDMRSSVHQIVNGDACSGIVYNSLWMCPKCYNKVLRFVQPPAMQIAYCKTCHVLCLVLNHRCRRKVDCAEAAASGLVSHPSTSNEEKWEVIFEGGYSRRWTWI